MLIDSNEVLPSGTGLYFDAEDIGPSDLGPVRGVEGDFWFWFCLRRREVGELLRSTISTVVGDRVLVTSFLESGETGGVFLGLCVLSLDSDFSFLFQKSNILPFSGVSTSPRGVRSSSASLCVLPRISPMPSAPRLRFVFVSASLQNENAIMRKRGGGRQFDLGVDK